MAASQRKPLKEACVKIGSGATPRGGKEAYRGGATALIRSQNVYNDQFSYDGLAYIDDAQAEELANVVVCEGDVLLNITGDSVARCCRAPADVIPARVNQHVAIIRPDASLLHAGFLRYVLVSPEYQHRLLALASAGATRNALTKGMIETLEVPLPALPEQKRIAHILGTLDNKIELNRRMNATLEGISRALFKSWFVDFDPVRQKAAGKQPVGMDAKTAAMFPDSFEDSEIGEVAKGWTVQPISELAEIAGGSTPSTKEPQFWDSGVHHWATPKDLSNLSVPVLLDTERRLTHSGVAQITSGLLPAGTVLLSSRAPIGYLAITETPVAINQGFIAMKPKDGVSNLFLLRWTATSHDEIVSRANGSTFLEISKSNFRPIPAVRPTQAVMDAFHERAFPLFRRVVACERESRTLAALRDTLLPKLLSGGIRVPDAEKAVEEATA